ncbi:BMP family ABC transporter substrate-binding protein [Bacillus carboniphilus]|uniref:BMP family ABC transporter substrate-binding protein n=1 Tax=Bacillus carboniphilus TaxID=86663 RepID=A0ABY9JW02_9BACI|nr:BMP family ABC transporter substrate-binding protein [Bacillus carboniphilus]WLR42938.1 BMP family ABC transporter substrate-binding protein [Bacillus carboniphilus]
MKLRISLILLLLFSLLGCEQMQTNNLNKVGLLVYETVNDQVWGTKGYKGLLKIQSELGVDVDYKDQMNNESAIKQAVKEFDEDGINLVFGHGVQYEDTFNSLSKQYPSMHFVFFNGDAQGENVTSLNFEAYSMGFFAGMIAAYMSETKQLGVIASKEWQQEVVGFKEGALFQDSNVKVDIEYTDDWDNVPVAQNRLDSLLQKQADVVYPAGDGYNVPVIERLKEEGKYAIGYITDQSVLGEQTVLTSTVQHVDELYVLVAKRFQEGNLTSGNLTFGFEQEIIDLGEFSPLIDEDFIEKIENDIKRYKESGELPNEKE